MKTPLRQVSFPVNKGSPKKKIGENATVKTWIYVHNGKAWPMIRLSGPNVEMFGNAHLEFSFKAIPFKDLRSRLSATEILKAISDAKRRSNSDVHDEFRAVLYLILRKKGFRIRFFFKDNEMLWAKMTIGKIKLKPVEGQSIGAIY